MSTSGLNVVERILSEHRVTEPDAWGQILYVDVHYLNEVSSPAAFDVLNRRNLPVRRPDATLAVADHRVPSGWPSAQVGLAISNPFVEKLLAEAKRHGIPARLPGEDEHGIIHVVGPTTGRSVPGMLVASGDSHTPTQGAIGVLGFGLAGPEVAHVLATQCFRRPRLGVFGVSLSGRLDSVVEPKDLMLHLLRELGPGFASGHILEFYGQGLEHIGIEGRAVMCNLAVECGATSAIVGVDETTLAYIERAGAHEEVLERASRYRSDVSARREAQVRLDLADVEPMVTYGTAPSMAIGIRDPIPAPRDAEHERALAYMGWEPGSHLLGVPTPVIFVGSCANGWLEDLRVVARHLAGRRVHPNTELLVVPASERIRRDAEREGLLGILEAAGAYVGHPGCSMCTGTNGDLVDPGQVCLSTSNRNHRNRQGVGARTVLCSPSTAAVSAIHGRITDPRDEL